MGERDLVWTSFKLCCISRPRVSNFVTDAAPDKRAVMNRRGPKNQAVWR
jgi:hypothetical protein